MAAGGTTRLSRRRDLLVRLLTLAILAGFVPFGNAPSAAPDRTLRLVALGDSLTAGYLLPDGAAFPAVLEANLRARGHDVTVANAGVSGDTAADGLARLDGAVPEGTDGVILELGANDMLRRTDPDVTSAVLTQIVSRLIARGIPVMIAGMQTSSSLDPDFAQRFNAVHPDLARRYRLVLYPYFLDGVAGNPRLNLFDGVHPSSEGVRRIVDNILPSVERFLATLPKRTNTQPGRKRNAVSGPGL